MNWETHMSSARLRCARRAAAAALLAACTVAIPTPGQAGCGCDKPPPPRAAVRPFAGYPDQVITLFDSRLVAGKKYWVQFVARDGSSDWSRGKATTRRDFADKQMRTHLRVPVGAVSLGPCQISVWKDDGAHLYSLDDHQFTVTAPPVPLSEIDELIVRDDYQAGVGSDGTMYITVDVSKVSEATTFTGIADGYALAFEAGNVAMYNAQGFLMQLLDPTAPGLFQIARGDTATSDALSYWRHEFATYKREHRQQDGRSTDDDPDWHADGTPHIDHDMILVAISGTLADGAHPEPGATPPFRLLIGSTPSPASPLGDASGSTGGNSASGSPGGSPGGN
jgi:hypothetical protein